MGVEGINERMMRSGPGLRSRPSCLARWPGYDHVLRWEIRGGDLHYSRRQYISRNGGKAEKDNEPDKCLSEVESFRLKGFGNAVGKEPATVAGSSASEMYIDLNKPQPSGYIAQVSKAEKREGERT